MSAESPTSPIQAHLLLKFRDAARTLQISERTLFELTKSGALPVVKIGRSVRFDVRDLLQFIDAMKSRSTNP